MSLQEIARTGIDLIHRKDTVIGREREVCIAENEVDLTSARSYRWVSTEVVVGVVFGHRATVAGGSLERVSAPYRIRTYGDPVLKQVASDVTDIDGSLVKLCDDMFETMYEEPGLGLAATQVGVKKRLFVYDLFAGDDPRVLINPEIRETDGEWEFEEGCLSVPGLSWNIVRPKQVHVVGLDLDGNDVSIEADELEARLFQHELDHLNGVLLVEHLDDDQRREAMKILRHRADAGDSTAGGASQELGLPLGEPRGLSLP